MFYPGVILTLTGLALAAPSLQPPPPKLIDTYRAASDSTLPSPASGFSYFVGTFSFSPDERWIGVTLGAYAAQRGVRPVPDSTLLLLPLSQPGDRRISIHAGPRSSFLWSPDSQAVLVFENYGKVPSAAQTYNLRGELVSTGPAAGPVIGFIAPGRVLVRHAATDGRVTGFDILDLGTAVVTRWRGPKHGQVAAVDSERGLVAMFPDSQGWKTRIIDAATGREVQSVKSQNQVTVVGAPCPADAFSICEMNYFAAPVASFAENGKTLCEAVVAGTFKSYPVCRDVDTGKTIAEFTGVDGGAPANASRQGSRMALSTPRSRPGGHIVWDFRLGIEVAAWPGPRGASSLPISNVAISASGKYVAEAIADELHIYEIP